MILDNYKRTVSVVITCCNEHHQYLPKALDSVCTQTAPPDEILIVYDQTKPSITLLPYLQVQYGNPFLSRKAGFEQTTKEVVCFLDADDFISDDYIAAGLAVKTDNNIVYCDVQQFGNIDRKLFYHQQCISQENYLAVASLVSRQSIEISNAFYPTPPLNCHEDWVFWRRLIRAGCPTTKQTGIHFHREHQSNRSKNIDDLPFHIAKGVCCDQVKLIQISGDYPIDNNAHLVIPYDLRAINDAIRNTNAEYLLFSDHPSSLDVDKMLQALDRHVIVVQLWQRLLWFGTLIVTDVVQQQLPLREPVGNFVYL